MIIAQIFRTQSIKNVKIDIGSRILIDILIRKSYNEVAKPI